MEAVLTEAVRFLERALAERQVEAALVLGDVYSLIAREPEWHDPARGAAYYRQCADALVPQCLFAYGRVLQDGAGLTRDAVAAYAYLALALQGRLLLQNIPPQPYKVLRAAGIEKITEIREECNR